MAPDQLEDTEQKHNRHAEDEQGTQLHRQGHNSAGEEGEDTGHAGGQAGDGRRLSAFILRAFLLEEAKQGTLRSGEQREEAPDGGHESVRQEIEEEGKQFFGQAKDFFQNSRDQVEDAFNQGGKAV